MSSPIIIQQSPDEETYIIGVYVLAYLLLAGPLVHVVEQLRLSAPLVVAIVSQLLSLASLPSRVCPLH